MASAYLSRTFGTPTDENKWTFSAWVKNSKVGQVANFFNAGTNYSNNVDGISFDGSNHTFRVYAYPGSYTYQLITNRLFRDPSAWYHLVVTFDSDQSTASDRLKLYVNGEQETSFSTSTYPSSGVNSGHINKSGRIHTIGSAVGGADALDGLMTHIHFTDGYAYSATDFGETDSTSGIWKPKTAPSVTYGTNGFFLKMENSSDFGEDSSGNNNDFTTSGTITQTEDTPSNNFATLNALKKLTGTLSNGNTTWSANGDNGIWSTLGVNTGKWYWETQNNANNTMTGIASEDVTQATDRSSNAGVYGIQNGTTYGYYRNNGSSGQSTGFPDPTTSVTVCHALDLDNGKYFMGVDGVFKNLSGTTSDLSAGTNPTFSSLDTTKFWFPFIECRGTGAGADINFGNGRFGTTALASSNSDSAGLGLFEYSVPSGYYALCTKNIKNYG